MNLRLLGILVISVCLSGCYNRVLPGLWFGPGGAIVEITPEDLQRTAKQVVEEQLNKVLLDKHWLAEATIIGLPNEDIDRPYNKRWYWTEATVIVTLIGDDQDKSPPVSLEELKRIAKDTMQRATDAEEGVQVSLRQEFIEPAALQQRTPAWLKALRRAPPSKATSAPATEE